MPTSKQARARQSRQRERLAVLHAEREVRRRRRRRIGGAIGAFVIVLGIVLAIVAVPNLGNDDTPKNAANQPTTPTTTAAVKTCVAVKDPLPKGAPAVPITPGPPAAKLVTKDLKVGTGAEVKPAAKKVTVKYIGVSCSTGKIFDSSYSRGDTFPADLDPQSQQGVIKGWQQGIPGMKVGGRRLLEIPPDLAYGPSGSPPAIGPNETLFFVVDVVGV